MIKTANMLEEISSILHPVFVQNAVIRAAIFGSYARGEQNADSDIDLVVEFADGASLLNLGGLFEDIRDTIGKDVDIITYHSLKREPKDFAENVIREAKVIYEAD